MPRGLQGKQENSRAEEGLLVVSNSSVIIALARICHLDLLEKLFRRIIVPEAVWKEAVVEDKPGHEKIVRAEFIRVEKAGNRRSRLHGERPLEALRGVCKRCWYQQSLFPP